ncbi:MAG: hypothetical protein HFJ04_01255 [Lachnospiraceae bacterium]|nr:hypothetical protein [Lachnospiraceae bacterium]
MVTVSASGTVKAKKAGKTTITAKTESNHKSHGKIICVY